jgi:dTDP-4-amino-4,6-dideoxygalactose transaminase
LRKISRRTVDGPRILRHETSQFKKLDTANRRRTFNARLYNEGLGDLDGIEVPYTPKHCLHVYHQYTIRVLGGRRDALRERLKAKGIGTGVYYPKGLYDSPVLKGRISQKSKAFPETGKASAEVLSLPVHPLLSKADIARVIKSIVAFME